MSEQVTYCGNCGSIQQPGQKFCAHCGAMSPAPQQSLAEPVPVQEPVVQEPVVQEPVVQEPVVQEPVVQEAAVSAPEKPKGKTGKKPLVIAVAVVLVLAVLAAGAVWLVHYLSPQQKVIRLLVAKDYKQALKLYESEDPEDVDALKSYVKERLPQMREDYAQGKLAYADIDLELNVYESMELRGTKSSTDEARAFVELVHVSREAFDQAAKLEKDGDYPAAMDYYAQVIKEDEKNYDNSRKQITACETAFREKILAEAEAYAQEELYEDALAKVEEGLTVLPEDTELLAQRDAYADTEAVYRRNKLLEAAAAYVEEGDYAAALRTLVDHCDDVEIDVAYKNYARDYEEKSLKDAEAAMEETGYADALAIIEACLQSLPESQELLEAKDYYMTFAPVPISGYDIMATTAEEVYQDEHTRDKYENLYTTSFAVDAGQVKFLTNGKFTRFTGTLVCPYDYEYDAYRTGATVTVYADDVKIYQSNLVENTSKPQAIDLDITGVEVVTLVWDCQGGNIWSNWGYRATIFDGVFVKE